MLSSAISTRKAWRSARAVKWRVRTLPSGLSHAWAWVARVTIFFVLTPDVAKRCIIEEGANPDRALRRCGLDARPYRIALPSTLQWIDMPDFDRALLLTIKESARMPIKPTRQLRTSGHVHLPDGDASTAAVSLPTIGQSRQAGVGAQREGLDLIASHPRQVIAQLEEDYSRVDVTPALDLEEFTALPRLLRQLIASARTPARGARKSGRVFKLVSAEGPISSFSRAGRPLR